MGEAIGQLAAWAAMAAVEFGQRPVAGLAGSIELLGEPRPGQVLELAADLEHLDAESVEHRGTLRLKVKLKQHSPDQASLAFERRAADEVIAIAGLTLKVGDGL